MSNLCAVTSDLNRYLAAEDRAEARAEAVTNQAAELLEGDYSPMDPANISEALGEIGLKGLVAMLSGVPERARVEDFLRSLNQNYWIGMARNQAGINVSNACSECFGHGCNKCSE